MRIISRIHPPTMSLNNNTTTFNVYRECNFNYAILNLLLCKSSTFVPIIKFIIIRFLMCLPRLTHVSLTTHSRLTHVSLTSHSRLTHVSLILTSFGS
eukprot:sb/3479001/